jgi:hypothetical protein
MASCAAVARRCGPVLWPGACTLRFRALGWLFPNSMQVSQIAISALVCKNVGTEVLPEYLLQYDSRIDCLSPEYTTYRIFAWIMAGLWPIGFPLSLLILLKSYRVPEIAARKVRQAKIRAFILHSLAKASEIGIEWTEAVSELFSSFEEMGLPLLLLLGKVHGVHAASATVFATELANRMNELIDSEAVSLPLIAWDEESLDPEERLACARLESLIGAYEVKWWWCVYSLWFGSLWRIVKPISPGARRHECSLCKCSVRFWNPCVLS